MSDVGILIFPGTNSEEETLRACLAVGLRADLVPWTTPLERVRRYGAYVLPGGFAYEDRVRAGAIAAHDALMEAVREGAAEGKPVLGICNGAQILLESGLVPAFDGDVRPRAGFTRNAPRGKYVSRRVFFKLAMPPARSIFTRWLPDGLVMPGWASHGEGRLAAEPAVLERIVRDRHLAFIYCDERGDAVPEAVPNGSALGAAALINAAGNVLAIMPHAERDAWTFMHAPGAERTAARGNREEMLSVSGGIALFAGLAGALVPA